MKLQNILTRKNEDQEPADWAGTAELLLPLVMFAIENGRVWIECEVRVDDCV
jgi:hypothetical protein